ncbi:MAG: PASTA domain-containing protein, partial [Kiritimatiellaceae bacterium]|nr:PASTA domain-containing protein [Kiritimatiellaceae bacterium]
STFNGWQYVSYYNNQEKHCVGRRKLPDGAWETFSFNDYTLSATLIASNGHCNTVIGICEADGTIHLAFDHHNLPLHYRVSQAGVALNPESVTWGPELFSEVRSTLTGRDMNKITYPRFIRAPNGDLTLYYRGGSSGDGDGFLYEYSAATGWTFIGEFIHGTGNFDRDLHVDPVLNRTTETRNPYFNGLHYDRNGRLHATWCWRETNLEDWSTNHDLMYAYSDDRGRTWYNSAGKLIGVAGSHFIKLSSEGVKVFDIPTGHSYMNQTTQAIDSQGRVHVITFHMLPESPVQRTFNHPTSMMFHYVRMENGEWRGSNMGIPMGQRPKLVIDSSDNLLVLYKQVGQVNVAAAEASNEWANWSVILTDTNSIGSAIKGEPTIDMYRWNKEQVMSVWTHDLWALDYQFNYLPAGPDIHSKPGRYVEAGSPFSYTFEAVDPQNDPVVLSAVKKPFWLSFNPQTGLLSGTPSVGDIGTHPVTLRATDGTTRRDQEFVITVNAVGNDAPVFTNSPAVLYATELQPFSYVIKAFDTDGDTLTHTMPVKPAWLTLHEGTASGRPMPNHIGTNSVVFTVSDGLVIRTQTVSLVALPASMKVRNLVQNGSFETGNATGWTITDPAATVASGTASHQQFALKYANCTDGKVDKTWQKVTVLTNTDYVFRYSINRPQKLSGNLKAQLTMGPVIRYTYREASAGWKTETVRFNSGTNTSVIIELYADGTFTDTIYLDDIILAPAKTIVPNVTGLMQSAAETSLIAAGCTVGTVSGGYVHGAQPGTVLAQSPVSGQGVLLDTAVDLLVMETIAPSASATWISGTGSSDWAASQNWSGGTVPERETQVRFIGTGASECVLTNAVTVRQLVVGDEGSTSSSTLRLKAGADLYCGIQSNETSALTAIGYAYPSTLIVETNALFSTHSNLWIAFSGGNSSLQINGGQVAVASTLHLGSSSNSSRGLITVDGSGQLSCAGILVH